MIHRALAMVVLVLATSCKSKNAEKVDENGDCTATEQCKGYLVCTAGKCVDPPARSAAETSPSPSTPAGLGDIVAPRKEQEGEGVPREIKGPRGDASVGGVGVAGGAVANASAVVARMKGRFRACYQSGLSANPDMAGSVVLVAKIGPNGEVQGVSGGGGSLAPIVGCLKSVVQGGSFAPPDGGSALLSIPITFVKQ
jgi:hypothetical protein